MWLLLALRSAAYHAYCPMTSGLSAEQGVIRLQYSKTSRTLRILNTGIRPFYDKAGPHAQLGWVRDLLVFKRERQAWRVVEHDRGMFSMWSDSEKNWITTLQHIEG